MESGGWTRSSTAKLVASLLGIVAFIAWYGGGSPVYIAEPIDARVVDAETGQPIDGAVVTANWQLVAGGLDGQRAKGQLEIRETVTDRDGRFHFDGFVKLNLRTFELRNEDPKILVFKGGYHYAKVINQYAGAGTHTPGMRRVAAASGKTIKLKRLRLLDPSQNFGGLDIELMRVIDDCQWKRIPRMIVAADYEYSRLRQSHPDALIRLPTIDGLEGRRTQCGSAIEYFKEYGRSTFK